MFSRKIFKVAVAAATVLALGVGMSVIRQGKPMIPLVATADAAQVQTVYLYLDILGGFKLGPDGKSHDAFSPWQMKVPAGDKVVLTIYNWDSMGHSFTSKALGVDVVTNPAPKEGKSSVTVVKFTAPRRPGTYKFFCKVPCDFDNGQWSMRKMGYMIGQLVVVAP